LLCWQAHDAIELEPLWTRDVTGELTSKLKRVLLSSVMALGVLAASGLIGVAHSKDGDSGGGGNSGSGSGNSGSGSSNSGSGSGSGSGHDGQDDDRDDDDDDDSSSGNRGRGRDQERARDAVKSGKVKPLGDVLRMVSERAPGDVLRVKLNRSGGQLIYRITILTDEGRYREVVVNAQSNRVVSMRWR
jgi:uncharacterized membrane protein YkoI